MRPRLAALWERLWFRPASPLGLVAARILLSAQALWIVLSRPDLPELRGWPPEFWAFVDPVMRLRFGIVAAPDWLERSLFLALHGMLVATLLGVAPRLAAFLSAVLLYHFAPFEEILVGMPYTSFGGLTLPVLGLFILAFAEAPDRDAGRSPEYRWPLTLLRILFAFSYLFPGLLKLRYSGLGWFTGPNISAWLIANYGITQAPGALWIASRPAVSWAVALGTMVLELGFVLVVLSRAAALVLVPMAVAFHLGIAWSVRYWFLSLPMLLLYVDWDWLDDRLRRRRLSGADRPEPRDGRRRPSAR